MGAAYNDLGEHQRAIQDFDQAISLNPQDALAYNNRGIAYVLATSKSGTLLLRRDQGEMAVL